MIAAFVVYPYLKRFTPLCHLWLGVVDGLAPVGGWVAVTGHFDLAAWLLGAAVACWIAGFDIIYATMDIEVDRAQGLHSRAGRLRHRARAVHLARAARAQRGRPGRAWAGRSGSARSTSSASSPWPCCWPTSSSSSRPTDLSRVDMAFLSVNGVIALLYFGTVTLDVAVS